MSEQRADHGVIRIGDREFRASGKLNAWLMMKISQAERKGDIDGAFARFADLVEQAVHPDDVQALDEYLSGSEIGIDELRNAMAEIMLGTAKEAGFTEVEAADPTGPSSSGPASSRPTPALSTANSSSPGTDPIHFGD